MSLEVREQRQLRRLETLVDVVFGITIWRLFVLLPRPDENPEWTTLLAMLADSLLNFVVVVIALIIVIIYWIQSNLLFKYLVRTDSWHIGLSIAQLFSLLLFLYAIRVGIQLEANASTRVFESAMACLLGMFSFFAWYYALHRGSLVTDELGVEEAKSITERIKAEPVTAAITIPFAAGMWMWELSWFIYPFVVYLLKRRNKRSASGVSD
ncbi:MAG: TMEM175 family protein [Gammaproteobacteria bacterium]|jgi:uncharacterized membrane protein